MKDLSIGNVLDEKTQARIEVLLISEVLGQRQSLTLWSGRRAALS